MARVVRTPRVLSDLEAIWLYVAIDNPRAADRLYRSIDDRMRGLADFPLMGPPRTDIGAEIRALVEGRYLILYTYDATADLVEIITVVDGARDLGSAV